MKRALGALLLVLLIPNAALADSFLQGIQHIAQPLRYFDLNRQMSEVAVALKTPATLPSPQPTAAATLLASPMPTATPGISSPPVSSATATAGMTAVATATPLGTTRALTPTPALTPEVGAKRGLTITLKGHQATIHYPPLEVLDQLFMYLGILIGVISSAAIQQAQKGGPIQIRVSLGGILTSAVIALLLMPYVFKQSIDPTSPFLVRFGLFVQNGVFWQVAFNAASKLAGAA